MHFEKQPSVLVFSFLALCNIVVADKDILQLWCKKDMRVVDSEWCMDRALLTTAFERTLEAFRRVRLIVSPNISKPMASKIVQQSDEYIIILSSVAVQRSSPKLQARISVSKPKGKLTGSRNMIEAAAISFMYE